LFLATDNEGRMVFHVAAVFSNIEVFQLILNMAKKNRTKEEVKKLILTTNNMVRMVFLMASDLCDLDLFE
jgi:hypothetical protein